MYESQNVWKLSKRLACYKVLSVPIAEEYIKICFYGQQMQQVYQLLWHIHTEFIQR